MHVDRFYKLETSGKRLYAIFVEGETCRDFEGIGEGRTKTPDRWVRSQYAQLLVDYQEGRLEFLSFTRKAARLCAKGTYGLGRHKFIRDAAIDYLRHIGELDDPNPKVPEVFNVIQTNRVHKSPGRHTYRPKVLERR